MTPIKIFGRAAALLSFLLFLGTGLCFLLPAIGSGMSDSFVLLALGLFFIGIAVLSGSLLWLVTERVSQKRNGP